MRIKVVVLALILPLLFSLSLAAPAWAAGMTPSQGIVGSTVTISGLSASASYTIKWDDTVYKTGTVPSSGDVDFIVPETSGGAHTVTVENPTGTPVSVSPNTFTVLPSMAINPNSGSVGTSITVTGTGFSPAETSIKVTYDDQTVKTGITADDNGSWDTTFTVPSSAKGNHVVDVLGSTTEATDVADKTFTVSPKISITPTSGSVGTSVTVTGTGFVNDETAIKVTYDGLTLKAGITASGNGAWSTTFVVPDSAKGSHALNTSGSSTDAAEVTDISFTVMPGVSIQPTSGYVDDEIEMIGSGFGSNESGIKVTFDGTVIRSGITASENGYWTTSFTIPGSVNGVHAIDSYGITTTAMDVSDASLTVLAQVIINPNTGNVGDNIKVRGTGFSGKENFTISYDDVLIVTGLTTSSEGNFSASFEAPKGKSGEITVTATDTKDVAASAIFTMETTPPTPPQIASPKDGGRVGFIGDVKITFDWTDVTDPSGVYYTLEVSDQHDFGTTLVSYADLTRSEYTLSAAEALPHGDYYWRVRAVDGAGNASDWTTPAMVKAGFMTLKTLIIIVAAIIVFIILLSVLPRFIPKKSEKWTSSWS